jgi:hypothetical protein
MTTSFGSDSIRSHPVLEVTRFPESEERFLAEFILSSTEGLEMTSDV